MRNLDPALAAALQLGVVVPAIFAQLTFTSGVYFCWTGYGPLLYAGNTYIGLGQLAGMGDVNEGTDGKADGLTLTLSGIDPTLYQDCLNDIQLGAPAIVSLALLANGQVIGQPATLFAGLVDQPTINEAADTITVALQLENKMVNLQRPSVRRYTPADQHMDYADDTGFNSAAILNDAAYSWGT